MTAIRHADDFYSTPDWVTALIVPFLPLTLGTVIFDPCAGDGALLDSFRTRGYTHTYGIELNPDRARKANDRAHRVMCADALTPHKWLDLDPLGSMNAIVVTNPPFVLALEFVTKALTEWHGLRGPMCVAMLLRLNWLASQGRANFLWVHTPLCVRAPEAPQLHGRRKDRPHGLRLDGMVWDGTRPTVTILPNG